MAELGGREQNIGISQSSSQAGRINSELTDIMLCGGILLPLLFI